MVTTLVVGGFVGSFVLGHEWNRWAWPLIKSKVATTRLGTWLASWGKG